MLIVLCLALRNPFAHNWCFIGTVNLYGCWCLSVKPGWPTVFRQSKVQVSIVQETVDKWIIGSVRYVRLYVYIHGSKLKSELSVALLSACFPSLHCFSLLHALENGWWCYEIRRMWCSCDVAEIGSSDLVLNGKICHPIHTTSITTTWNFLMVLDESDIHVLEKWLVSSQFPVVL